jgi:hypothetical protein
MHIILFPRGLVIDVKNLKSRAIFLNPNGVFWITSIVPKVKLVDKVLADEHVHVLYENFKVSPSARETGHDDRRPHLF